MLFRSLVSEEGPELAVPLLMSRMLMSRTSTVPVEVPLLFQSSRPLVPSSATKNSVPLTLVSQEGLELAEPELMSLTRTVPVEVPLLFQSSRPFVPSLAMKNSVPLTLVSEEGPNRNYLRRCP